MFTEKPGHRVKFFFFKINVLNLGTWWLCCCGTWHPVPRCWQRNLWFSVKTRRFRPVSCRDSKWDKVWSLKASLAAKISHGIINNSCMTGWWFGTWILFFHILGIVIPADFHLFQRGRSTTNQMIMYPFYPCLTIYRWCSQRTKPPFSAGISHPLGIFFRCLWRRIMKDFGVAMG